MYFFVKPDLEMTDHPANTKAEATEVKGVDLLFMTSEAESEAERMKGVKDDEHIAFK